MLGLLPPTALLARARLLLLPRVCSLRNEIVDALLQCTVSIPGSWADTVVSDLDKLWHVCGKLADLPSPRAEPQAWIGFAIGFPKAWRSLVNAWSGHLCASPPPGRPGRVARAKQPCMCYQCERECASSAALQGHLTKVHGARPLASKYACSDGACNSCMKVFHSRARL
eukprot:8420270-Alexandrium_andersonii.AAC.1